MVIYLQYTYIYIYTKFSFRFTYKLQCIRVVYGWKQLERNILKKKKRYRDGHCGEKLIHRNK